ncbi:MAG: phosphorylase [Bacteroidia bacterium]|nr:phosphorylase [Bacteroidia bacterium]
MKASELPLRPDGSLYHLAIRPGEVSHRCMLVGDPNRVQLCEPFFERVLYRGGNREFIWLTGLYHRTLVTVVGTGIGADNTEIAVIEIDAVHNIDLSRGSPFPTQKKLYFLRIGTSGLLQDETSLGTVVFSEWAVGTDSLPLFYSPLLPSGLTEALSKYWLLNTGSELPWYSVRASPFFQNLAQRPPGGEFVRGITYSASGFFAPQGRSIRYKARFPELSQILASFSYEGYKVQNIEMEAAPLYYLAQVLGHEAGALCLGVAHRQRGELLYRNGGTSPEDAMRRLIKLGLDWLCEVP